MREDYGGEVTFKNLVDAGYSLISVQTHEEGRAIETLSEMLKGDPIEGDTEDAKGSGVKCYSWDVLAGLSEADRVGDGGMHANDPLGAIDAIIKLPKYSVLFVKDYHKFINNIEVIRKLKNCIKHLKYEAKVIAFIDPTFDIPIELEKDITVMTFALPTVDELMEMTKAIIGGTETLKDIEVDRDVIVAARGLVLEEAENAISLSLLMARELDKTIIENAKLQAVKKSGLMEICTPVNERELGGLKDLKEYVINRKKGFENKDVYPTPKGILLVGSPGTGKSLSAKVVANILGYPLVKLDISSLKGSLVGESERKMRQATDLIDAISPCVVWMDEIEKALSGVQSSGRTDGGTSSAMFGHLLTWMQESDTPKFMVATCNDIEELMSLSQGALLRRFDDVFWMDTPTSSERKDILKIMIKRYKLEDHPDIIADFDKGIVAKMKGWTGAEIEKFAKDCIYDGADSAYAGVRPIALQNSEVINKAKAWAKQNARSANTEKKVKRGRKINI